MKIVLLSCDSLSGYVIDEHFLVEALTQEGHSVSTLSWSADTDWKQFDCAVIRTTWDYTQRSQEFCEKLKLISDQTKLYNSLDTIKWNIHKSYLGTLEKKGVVIVPTLFFKHDEKIVIPKDWSAEKIVIKPAISAGAYQTYVVDRDQILAELTPGDWLCQPFLPQIKEGEISLIYFHKVFSHAVIKIPKAGDFRVQQEFGGDITAYTPSKELLKLGDQIMKCIDEDLLYGRVDVVSLDDHYALMELELIEPSMFFRTNPIAAKNFAKAIKDVS
jgi:glutathione synthase/RimK-type ligase-like ATP-grasp enzyme